MVGGDAAAQQGISQGLRVFSLNTNGVRAGLRKGLGELLQKHCPDVVLLQEIRCDEPTPELLSLCKELGLNTVLWNPAERKGYSGVALLARLPASEVSYGLGCPQTDREGRFLSALLGGVWVSSVYLPSGSSGPERQAVKDALLPRFREWALEQPAPHLIGGDLNIAHRAIDLKNWRANQKNSGFLPHEREFMDEFLQDYRDLHREQLGVEAEYTWWSNRGNAYANNTGWRIDYLLGRGVCSEKVQVLREARVSDHAPLLADVFPT